MTITAKIIADSISIQGDRITTLELEYPRMIHSEFMTHRCLAGNSMLCFDLPSVQVGRGNFRKYSMSIKEFYTKWKHGDSLGRTMQHRLNKMRLRMLNEDSNEVTHTTVTDIWEVGEKKTFTLRAGDYSITATDDHLILTSMGWKELKDITTSDFIITAGFGVQTLSDPLAHKIINGKWTSTWNRQHIGEVVAAQDNYCKVCGLTDLPLELHHILPVHTHPEEAFNIKNVVAACSSCHKNHYHKKQGWQVSQTLLGKPVRVTAKEFHSTQMVYDLSVSSDFHNFVANDIVVHNCFSRNAASSRAIPIKKMLQLVSDNPVTPSEWGSNKPGMQAGEELTGEALDNVKYIWNYAGLRALHSASDLDMQGLHKQLVNRIVEPFSHIKVIVTSTEFNNFFYLRDHEHAQPEIAELARAMKKAMSDSTPEELQVGDWHTPYVEHFRDEVGALLYGHVGTGPFFSEEDALKISASCCAQVSYRNLNDSLEKALDLYNKLVTSVPVHASAFEHCAKVMEHVHQDNSSHNWELGITHCDRGDRLWSGNFKGYIQYRQLIKDNVVM